MASPHDNEQLVRDFFVDLSTGELDRLRRYLTDETIWEPASTSIPGGKAHQGDAIITEFLGPVRGLFVAGDPKVIVDLVVADEKTVMCETRGIGTLGNGKPYNNQYAWRFSIADGKFTMIREYMDTAYVIDAVGL